LQGDRSASVQPLLRGSEDWSGSRSARAVGHTLTRENPRYGSRWVWALLRREAWKVNKKRVHRLWRPEGLKVPEKQHKRRRRLLLGRSENGCTRRRVEHKDHV
jgi:hypothetical protein